MTYDFFGIAASVTTSPALLRCATLRLLFGRFWLIDLHPMPLMSTAASK
jgi:hypothetical protein